MRSDFQALVVSNEPQFRVEVQTLALEDLPPGEVLIEVAYSSVNYKDGLAAHPEGRILRSYPFVPGIDLAGKVVSSQDSRYKEGDEVLITGYDLGVTHYGGYSQYARVPADWIVPLPPGLTLKEAMILGTAGFTAGMSVDKLQQMGIRPESGPILVTGATGGVGSTAVAMLAKLGYEVVASTGKASEQDFLRRLGASEVLSREEVTAPSKRALEKERWAGAVEPVGGATLPYVLRTVKYGGAVALSGLAGGNEIHTTVYPFILRGVQLLGIDSVFCPMDYRLQVWQRLATDMKPEHLQEIGFEVSLQELPDTLAAILRGEIRGRAVVRLHD